MKSLIRRNWDRAGAIALVVLGLLFLLVGWFGVSGTGLVAEQNPYLASGGLGGIALLAIGCTLWVSADLQDQWRRLDALEELLRAQSGGAAAPTTVEAAQVPSNGHGSAIGDRPTEAVKT